MLHPFIYQTCWWRENAEKVKKEKKKKNRMRRSAPTNPPTRESRHGLKWLIGQEGQLRGISGWPGNRFKGLGETPAKLPRQAVDKKREPYYLTGTSTRIENCWQLQISFSTTSQSSGRSLLSPVPSALPWNPPTCCLWSDGYCSTPRLSTPSDLAQGDNLHVHTA